jgi:hypothetical protein
VSSPRVPGYELGSDPQPGGEPCRGLVRCAGARSTDHFSRTAALLAALALLLGAGSAERCDTEGTIYGLTVDGSFQQGCFPPLACPVQIPQAVGGTFRLLEIPRPGLEIEQFLVTDLFWLVRLRGEDVRITGSGTLTRFSRGPVVVQRLGLFLRIGDAEAEAFDSGFVVDRGAFPDLDITISIHGQRGIDTVIRVDAVPFPHPRRGVGAPS